MLTAKISTAVWSLRDWQVKWPYRRGATESDYLMMTL